jgi:hypothetical protein
MDSVNACGRTPPLRRKRSRRRLDDREIEPGSSPEEPGHRLEDRGSLQKKEAAHEARPKSREETPKEGCSKMLQCTI